MGTQEVVLTGVHIGDYEDSGRGLSHLLQAVLRETKIARIRLSSFEPPEVTDEILDLFNDPRVCPHFHMSIQSADSKVLKDMKRNYEQKDVEQVLRRIERHVPNAFVGMDVIAGFPTETEACFEETFRCLSDLPWTRLHVFPYSPRPGTRATQMEGLVTDRDKKLRAHRLRLMSSDRYLQHAEAQVGQMKSVLVLQNRDGVVKGLSRDYWPVVFANQPFLERGKEQRVMVTGLSHHDSRPEPTLVGHFGSSYLTHGSNGATRHESQTPMI